MAGIELDGVDELISALSAMQERAKHAARTAAENMATVARDEIKRQVSMTSHEPGTPTPSAPGTPPAMISGRLRDSTRLTQSFGEDSHWETHAAPTTVYARIQDLGGWTGAGHRTYLPARPYMRPSMIEAREKIQEAALRAFRDVVEGH